jgi:hypothetical protein
MSVVSLVTKSAAFEKEINEQVVKILADMLEDAKIGKITELITMYQDDKGDYGHAFSGSENLIESLGMLERMKHMVNLRLNNLLE